MNRKPTPMEGLVVGAIVSVAVWIGLYLIGLGIGCLAHLAGWL